MNQAHKQQETVYRSALNADAYGTCHIDDFPSGYIEFFTCQNDEGISFTLPPTEEGVFEAGRMVSVLNSWIEKTQTHLSLRATHPRGDNTLEYP